MAVLSVEDLANYYVDVHDRIYLFELGRPAYMPEQQWNELYPKNIKFLEDALLEPLFSNEQRETITAALNKFKV